MNKANKCWYLSMSIACAVVLAMTFFIKTNPINQIALLAIAVICGFASGMVFMADMD